MFYTYVHLNADDFSVNTRVDDEDFYTYLQNNQEDFSVKVEVLI